ncbi:hypothetical protein KIPB_009244, partial [Kipferlia bialata]
LPSIKSLIGLSVPKGGSICDFMDLPAEKLVAKLTKPAQCVRCLNCLDCPYQAITASPKITVDPLKCIGCSLCVRRCPGQCLDMVVREEGVPQPLI